MISIFYFGIFCSYLKQKFTVLTSDTNPHVVTVKYGYFKKKKKKISLVIYFSLEL